MEWEFTGLITVKAVIGFISLFVAIKLTGRASLNKLTPFHLVFVMVLGNFLGNAIYENKVRILDFVYSVGLWALLMYLTEVVALKKNSARSLLDGKPSLIIRDGILNRELLKKNKIDINQVLSMLRQNQIFSVREVKYGFLEANGQISTLLQFPNQPPKKQDLHVPESPVHLPVSLILDGKILWDNLQEQRLDKHWLYEQLRSHGYDSEEQIFYADWQSGQGLHISPK